MSIVPCLWFESEAVEAVDFYVRLLADSRITGRMDGPPGQPPISVDFELQGQRMLALNGRPADQPGFTDAMSLQVEVDSQDEIDRLWDALTGDGGAPGLCGWLRDRWGVAWQIVPKRWAALLQQEDPAAAARVMEAMMGMRKLVIAELEAAARG
ncbi:VOC family protein [Microcella alkalica]|uniref:VOC family protein n=1 Tax=Microcella alkalica TaxID=355930 RepID=UPI00145F38BC|nr:VOC family protein [Microcella alkalica]